MKWFDKFLYRKLRDMWDNKHKYNQYLEEDQIKVPRGLGMNAVAMVDESTGWEDGLRINVKKVIGGFVVSFRNYDRKLDRNSERHYIITDEQDFNKELGNMITLESMKQTA